MPNSDPLDIIFSPSQIARAGTAYIENRVSNKSEGIPFGVPIVDSQFLPMLPGELLTIIARPGHGKTMHLMRWARHRAQWLQDNQILDRIVVYLTYEMHTEELYAFHVAAEVGISVDLMARGQVDDTQLSLVRDYGVRRIAVPLWFMGHSQERRKKRPRIDLESVSNALRRVEDWEKANKRELKIDMLFVDYLQRMPFIGSPESKIIGMDENLNRIKDLGLEFSCPVACGVQGRREVDNYNIQIPEMGDGAWCSGIEQVSDKIMACVRPIKCVKKEGDMFGKTMVEGRNQALLVLWKQRLGDAPFFWWLRFDPQYNRLNEAEERAYKTINLTEATYSDV
jgi:replicative DNA helicase